MSNHKERWRVEAAASPRPHTTACAFVTRQPIYGPSMAATAYELLYKESALASNTGVTDAPESALRVMADAAIEIGLDRLAGGLPVHINYPRELLVSDEILSLHPNRVVIEVLEELPDDRELVAGVAALKIRGHRIALEDYSPRINDPALLNLVDIVKIDVSQMPDAELAYVARELKQRRVDLIADEVETVEHFERCMELGFHGFQGDFLQHPQTFRSRRVPAARLGAMRLVSALQNEDCAVEEAERLVSQDVSISYRVLRCINSSFYNLPKRVGSIRQAIVMLGMDNLRLLSTMVALQSLGDRPSQLYVIAMTRARMCEHLARLSGQDDDAGAYFITGLFSMLDVLVGMPMEEILYEMPLAPPIARALISEEGDLGAALRYARAYERGWWHKVSYCGLVPDVIRAAYVDSVFWAEEARAMMS